MQWTPYLHTNKRKWQTGIRNGILCGWGGAAERLADGQTSRGDGEGQRIQLRRLIQELLKPQYTIKQIPKTK